MTGSLWLCSSCKDPVAVRAGRQGNRQARGTGERFVSPGRCLLLNAADEAKRASVAEPGVSRPVQNAATELLIRQSAAMSPLRPAGRPPAREVSW